MEASEAQRWTEARIAEAKALLTTEDERALYEVIFHGFYAPGMRTGAESVVKATQAVLASDWLAERDRAQASTPCGSYYDAQGRMPGVTCEYPVHPGVPWHYAHGYAPEVFWRWTDEQARA